MKINADTNKLIKDLEEPDFLVALEKSLEEVIIFGETEKAFWLALNLEQALKDNPGFERNYPETFKKVSTIIKKARWVAISLLPEDEIVKMFKNDLMIMFGIPDYDIHSYFDSRLLSIFPLDMRDEFKDKVRKSMKENEEVLTKENIIVNGQAKNPTIGNWILHLRISLGTGYIPIVKLTEYIFQNPDINKLGENEKSRVETILKFYGKIKLSSQTPEGIETNIPVDDEIHKGDIVGGYFQPFKFNKEEYEKIDKIYRRILNIEGMEGGAGLSGQLETENKELKKEINKYGLRFEGEKLKTSEAIVVPIKQKIEESHKEKEGLLKTIKENEENIISRIKESPQGFYPELISIFQGQDPEKTAAALFILARLRKIDRLMSEMPVKKIFMEEIIPLLSRQIGSISAPELIDKFKQDPNNPVYVKIFLKYILGKAFEGREEESAFIATQLESILSVLENQEYLGLAFYNLKTDKYEWANVKKDESGDLIIE